MYNLANKTNDQEIKVQPFTGQSEEERLLYEKKKEALLKFTRGISNSLPSRSTLPNRMSLASRFKSEDVIRFMQNPYAFQKQLRQLSNYLYDISPQYRQIINHVATMTTYAYVVKPLGILDEDTDFKALEKSRLKVAHEVEKLSLSHEMPKTLKLAYKEDVVFGYEHETKDSFFIQHMDADYCQITSHVDGVLNYAFDFSYFNGNDVLLKSFPIEFQYKYEQYKNTKEQWIEMDSNKAFAFKVNEDILQYPLPPYATLFEPIFDLDDYKKIKKDRTKMDNFMVLVQHIPLNDKAQGMDDFLIDLDTAFHFHELASAGLPSGVDFITSPMKIDSIKMEKNRSDEDSVQQAVREIYTAGGVSQFLFNSDKNTSVGVGKSIRSDEILSFIMLRQVERWINRKLKRMSGRHKFKVSLLNITHFDEEKSFEKYLKGAQNGIPSVDEAAASIGISPLDLHNKILMNNNITKYHETLQPLKTSHTQSGDNEGAGRPQAGDDEVNESTIAWRETEAGAGET